MAVTMDEANTDEASAGEAGAGGAGAGRSAGSGLRSVQPAAPPPAPVSRASVVPVDTSGLGLGELIELAQTVAQDLAGRLCAADLTEQLEPVADSPSSDTSSGSTSESIHVSAS